MPSRSLLGILSYMFMKKSIYLSTLLLFLLRCTPSDEKELNLFNGTKFKLLEGEEVMRVNPTLEHDYRTYFDSSAIQVPLFKCIQGKDYKIYIGVPFNTSIRGLGHERMNQTSTMSPLWDGDSTTYFFIRYPKNSLQLTEFARSMDDNILYVLVESTSSVQTDSLFTKDDLLKRFTN